MAPMKYPGIFLVLMLGFRLYGQPAFEEDFEDLNPGLDLSTEGYVLSQHPDYTGSVFATVTLSENNKFCRMVAAPNGAAGMQIEKSIDVEPGKIYSYEMNSRGPFKRRLAVFSENGALLGSSDDYKPASDAEGNEWKRLELTFLSPPEASQVKIAFYHYWSGTIDLDDFIVNKTGEPGTQTAYYISSSSGNDDNPGTIEAPWQSLEKASVAFLFSGDSVLFKRGDTLRGHFLVNGSGSEKSPLLITAYGEGEKPVLTGQLASRGGGDYQEAILVENQDNIVFEDLEIHNERLKSRSGVSDTDAYGVYVKNTGDRVMQNLVFRNLSFKDVYAVQPILDPDDFNSIQVAGLSFFSSKNTLAGKEKHIRDVLVENCEFSNLQRFGISFKHSGGLAGIGNDSINRNMNILIRNNGFYHNGGTGVLPNATYNCLIENNIFDHPGSSNDPRMPGRGSSIWNFNAINTIMQYNMCLSTRGYLDSYGIHIDNRNVNTFVQYNYMEDCEGGFVEILKENKNAVYRFNVSVNDGWRKNETWANSNLTIWISSARWSNTDGNLELSDSCFIYNNTVVMDSAYTTAISMDATNIFVYNNIFSSINGSGMGHQNTVVRSNDTPFLMTNNLFEGTVDNRFINMDSMPEMGSPMFTGEGDGKYVYQLQEGSAAIDRGIPMRGPVVPGAGKGVFMDITAYPEVDFYGNPIDLFSGTPNIGACNVKYPADTSSNDSTTVVYTEKSDNWLIYPQPAAFSIQVVNGGNYSGEAEIFLYSLKGQMVQNDIRYLNPAEREILIHLDASLPNGIYILNIKNKGRLYSRRFVLYR